MTIYEALEKARRKNEYRTEYHKRCQNLSRPT